MDIKLGNLQIVPASEHPELMSESVFKAFSLLPQEQQALIGVAEIDSSFSDTAAFCEKYEMNASLAANCVVLEATRADRTWFAACVIPGTTRADVNGLARRTLDARKVSFAPMEKAVAETGMEYGGISPIGLPDSWTILVDKTVADSDYVIIGSGIRESKLAVPGSLFASLPNAQVIDGLGRVPHL
jgi:prolyl-tRNA editing enzyme YbaK/EbsC (Cys-tRNA(Pro) deacylase)